MVDDVGPAGVRRHTFLPADVVARPLRQHLHARAPDRATRTRWRSDFDQRHNLVLLLSYALPRRWRIGGRFRLVSGYPFTPVVGVVDYGQGTRQAVLGDINSDRLPLFHQLDVRVDKRWLLRRLSITAYVDVQNVYNRQNPEAVVYSYDYRDQIGFVGAPIFPSFGLRLDY